MSEELKPCPFCGGTARIERVGTPRQSTIYACESCGCRLETGEEFNHGARWNQRDDAEIINLRTRLEAAERDAARYRHHVRLYSEKLGVPEEDVIAELDAAIAKEGKC